MTDSQAAAGGAIPATVSLKVNTIIEYLLIFWIMSDCCRCDVFDGELVCRGRRLLWFDAGGPDPFARRKSEFLC
jgi:hypothetical protein